MAEEEKEEPQQARWLDTGAKQRLNARSTKPRKDIANTLDKKLHKKGIIGLNRTIEDGENVGARLHIPGYNAFDTWIVTVHEGTGQSGPVLGYGQLAVLDNVTFSSSPEAAYGIAATNKETQQIKENQLLLE